ncbi:hypothetical protein BTA49_07820 [Pseudomonas mosselii]|nr:hypothetical protein BTA49_07820 [Pseudomonas mosselii]
MRSLRLNQSRDTYPPEVPHLTTEATTSTHCSDLLTPDTHLGENARHREVSDDQATPYLYP